MGKRSRGGDTVVTVTADAGKEWWRSFCHLLQSIQEDSDTAVHIAIANYIDRRAHAALSSPTSHRERAAFVVIWANAAADALELCRDKYDGYPVGERLLCVASRFQACLQRAVEDNDVQVAGVVDAVGAR